MDRRRVGPGAFWQGMLDWVDGIRTIDQVFADIDAEWAALEAQGETSAARLVTSSTPFPPG